MDERLPEIRQAHGPPAESQLRLDAHAAQIQAITGHQNLKEIETYTKPVAQKLLLRQRWLQPSVGEVADIDTRLAENWISR